MRACQEAQRSRKRWHTTSTGEQLTSIRQEWVEWHFKQREWGWECSNLIDSDDQCWRAAFVAFVVDE
jgi:hypothetical protein